MTKDHRYPPNCYVFMCMDCARSFLGINRFTTRFPLGINNFTYPSERPHAIRRNSNSTFDVPRLQDRSAVTAEYMVLKTIGG